MRNRWLIGGAWSGDHAAEWLEVKDPASDACITRVPVGGPLQATAAVDAAEETLREWRATPSAHRADCLDAAAELLLKHQSALAHVMTQECGKPLTEAVGEVRYSADYFRSAAEQARSLQDESIDSHRPGVRAVAVSEPLGVCAAITPWNFPLAMLARKAAPALAAGCTMVAKPAEETPLSALALGELLLEAGVPHGALNVIVGDPEAIAATWLADKRVRKLSFTGSTEVGRLLMRGAADQLIRCSLELGGHAPFIVLAKADLAAAVQGAMASKFRNAGQTCICPNRFLVHQSLAVEFTAALAMAASELVVGSGLDAATQMGPLINDQAVAKVKAHVHDALQNGAHLVSGGRTLALSGRPDRFFMPTVLSHCTTDMLCFRQETFGPLAPIMAFEDIAHAVAIANATPWGLASYVYGPPAEAERVGRSLECGVVGVNESTPSSAYAPFGGTKWSGFGREGGRWGVQEYISTKYLAVRD